MTRKEFFATIGNEKPARCYLLEGEEEFVKRAVLDRLRQKTVGDAFPEMNDMRLIDPDADKLIAANETLPFMADMRITTVTECRMLLSKKAGRDNKDKTGDNDYDEDAGAEKLKKYLTNLPETSCLVFYVRGNADKTRKLYLALKKHAVIVTCDRLNDEELVKWVSKGFKQNGKSIGRETCQQLYFSVGRDLTKLDGEIAKLSAYADTRDEITAEDIEAVCTKTTECVVFDMVETLLNGNGKKAFEQLNALLLNGENRMLLLSLVGRQCRQLLSVMRMAAAKRSGGEIASAVGIPPFVVQKILRQARLYTESQLKEMTAVCLDTEYQVKSGRMNEEGSLEQVMLDILSIRKKGK